VGADRVAETAARATTRRPVTAPLGISRSNNEWVQAKKESPLGGKGRLSRLVVVPPVVGVFAKLVVEERVAILVVAAVPE